MKKALSIVLQFILFFAAFAAGIVVGVFSPLHLRWFVTHPASGPTHYFDPTGLLLMLALYLLILLIEVASKRLRRSGGRTTIAFAVALLIGLILKFGFVG